jgi:hypothetical protein
VVDVEGAMGVGAENWYGERFLANPTGDIDRVRIAHPLMMLHTRLI